MFVRFASSAVLVTAFATSAFAADEATRVLLIEAQAREALAAEAVERTNSDAVREYAEAVQTAAKESEAELAKQYKGKFDIRPSRGESEERPEDGNGLTAEEAGLLAGGAKPVKPSPGRWNPPGSRAVNQGVLDKDASVDASSGAAAAPAGENAAKVEDPAVRAAQQVREAGEKLAETMNSLDEVKGRKFDAAYLDADRKLLRSTLDTLKTADFETPSDRAMANKARKRIRKDLTRSRELKQSLKSKTE